MHDVMTVFCLSIICIGLYLCYGGMLEVRPIVLHANIGGVCV